jgi:mutator protein MutT
MKTKTIFWNEKKITLCQDAQATLLDLENKTVLIFPELMIKEKCKKVFSKIKKSALAQFLFEGNVEENLILIKKEFKTIKAGGGLVFNNKNLLFIYRRKKWDLPKGKLDKGETIEQCAIREIKEETGLKNVSLENFIDTTFHFYYEKEKLTMKETHWFEMTSGETQTKPQIEEDIEKIIWANETEWNEFFKNSFPSIEQIIKSWKEKGKA